MNYNVKKNIIGIDAVNIRAGGGASHLIKLVSNADPKIHKFDKIIIWGGSNLIGQLPESPWLIKINHPVFEKSILKKLLWQYYQLGKQARKLGCGVLFSPGGTNIAEFEPTVTMSQNMLPFDIKEVLRFNLTSILRFLLLRVLQIHSFKRSDGVIFLTLYAKNRIERVIKKTIKNSRIIPHGISSDYHHKPKKQHSIEDYNLDNPFRIIYISSVSPFKHQWNVAEAISRLRKDGYPITIDFIGPSHKNSEKRLMDLIRKEDPNGNFLNYSGLLTQKELKSVYLSSDLIVYASTCENLPIDLLEGMSSGLPIISSSKSPMPEVLNDAGTYFNSDDIFSIMSAIKNSLNSVSDRVKKSKISYNLSKNYSLKENYKNTFHFLIEMISKNS